MPSPGGRRSRILVIAASKVPLADRPGPLARDDVKCPICWSILIEPVSLPCLHCLCYACFKKHVEETSLQCPCCRMRLSVWSRKAFRENNVVDKKLWDRIQKEFPRLVTTRMAGEDSQDLLPEDLVSVFDKALPSKVMNVQGEKIDEFLMPTSRPLVAKREEFACQKGEIKRELEDMIKPHQEDIENQRRAEEEESQELIKKLQEQPDTPPRRTDNSRIEEDHMLAQRIAESEKTALAASINAKRKLFTNPVPKSAKSPGTSLFKSKSADNSPKTYGKRQSLSSLSSRVAKKQRSSRSTNLSQSASNSNNSQNIRKYLSVSLSQTNSSTSPESPKASTSASALRAPSPSGGNSAFLSWHRKEGDSSQVIPRQIFFQGSVLKQANSNRTETITRDVDEDNERDSSTPNSIDLEVNSHFRPILTAPKTPPRRLPDGSYLPEPSIIVISPVKPLLTVLKLYDGQKKVTSSEIGDKDEDRDCVISITPLINLQDTPLDDEIAEPGITTTTPQQNASLPVEAEESQKTQMESNSQSLDDDLDWFFKEETVSVTSSQASSMLKLDLDLSREQAQAFEILRARCIQEAEDRKLAKKLQKEFNFPSVRTEENPFSLRSWLNKANANSATSSTSSSSTPPSRPRRGSTRYVGTNLDPVKIEED